MRSPKDSGQGLFKGALELMILSSLLAKSMHGYAIRSHILLHSKDSFKIAEGSLYPALQRLLKAGYVTSKRAVSEKDRDVRLYELTRLGAAYLEQKAEQFHRMTNGICAVLTASNLR